MKPIGTMIGPLWLLGNPLRGRSGNGAFTHSRTHLFHSRTELFPGFLQEYGSGVSIPSQRHRLKAAESFKQDGWWVSIWIVACRLRPDRGLRPERADKRRYVMRNCSSTKSKSKKKKKTSRHGMVTYHQTEVIPSDPLSFVFCIVIWYSGHYGCRNTVYLSIHGIFQPAP
jgi:hypothetical protein